MSPVICRIGKLTGPPLAWRNARPVAQQKPTPNATPATAPIRPSSMASRLIIHRSPCPVRPSARSSADPLVRSTTAWDNVLAMPNSAIRMDVASRPSSSVASFWIDAVMCARSDASEVISISG
jgi:hypothetical protein